ncbi:MAG: TonB family protein [Paludibacter sp.]|nr:TonB family protein [Paludibacter sp.]MDD4198764.1 TonB family protein [Paludibacter sp.]MDD4426910.1 TonB family protein [Paludibacter sp.]
MNPLIIYFIKVNIAIALFYLFYRLFFVGDTLWKLRRFYLLGSILVSFTYPLFSITKWMHQSVPVQDMINNYSVLLQEITITANEPSKINFSTTLYLLYALISGFLLIRLLVQLISIIRINLHGKKIWIEQTEVIEVNKEIAPFSFFNRIYMNPALHTAIEAKEILAHERTHVGQLHSFDVLIGECMTIICWINPASWLVKKEIRHNLEFLADNQVIESGIDAKSYQYHLIRLAYQSPEIKLTNNFNVSPLKKRITMMNQKKTPKTGMLKYLLILPLVSALIISSNAESMLNSAKEAVKKQQTQQTPPPPSAIKELKTQQTPPPPPPPVKEDDVVFIVVEKMPQFPGGDAELFGYLSNSIKYPLKAQESNIQGRVICQFVVNRDGSISDVKIVRGADPSLDAEAIRVIKAMPNWIPGEQRGKKVRVKYTLPLNFKLDNKEKTGNPSINPPNQPVIVVDGEVKSEGFNLSAVNPADIEKVEVIKPTEENKTFIQSNYGERAVVNGVILITTKK